MIEQQNLYERGIDVSKWQGSIDWTKVAADGIQHVFIKMSEGGIRTLNFLIIGMLLKMLALKLMFTIISGR